MNNHSANNLPKAKWWSQKTPLVIGNIKIPCYVLEDGMRVLSGRGIQNVLGFNKKNSSGKELAKLLDSASLSPFFTPVIHKKFTNRIEFIRPGSGQKYSLFGSRTCRYAKKDVLQYMQERTRLSTSDKKYIP